MDGFWVDVRRVLGCSLLVAATALACAASGDDELDYGTAPEIWCRGLCAAQRRCSIAGSQCETSCVRDRPGLVNFSEDGARALRPCLAKLSCAALAEEAYWDSELDSCWDAAMKTVDISSHARSYCTVGVQAIFECGYNWTIDDCERVFSMWADPMIARHEACLEATTCDDLTSCNQAAWSLP